MEEINKTYPGIEYWNTFITNGKDLLGFSVTTPIYNVSLWLWGSHRCHDFNRGESWAFMKMEYFGVYDWTLEMHIL